MLFRSNFHLGSTSGESGAEAQSHAQAGEEEEEETRHSTCCPCAIPSTRAGTGCRHFAATRRIPLPARCRNPQEPSSCVKMRWEKSSLRSRDTKPQTFNIKEHYGQYDVFVPQGSSYGDSSLLHNSPPLPTQQHQRPTNVTQEKERQT